MTRRIWPACAYYKLKDLLINLYYLSEPGATVELRYEHVPARGRHRSR
jgi:hypothetical protein